MNVDLTTSAYYRVGGNLPPKAPSYVKREADEQLYQKLKDGEFCYVLNSRQMGKSSLWVRVKQRLEKEDYICAAVDLSGIGQGQLEQWYTSFANRLTKGFNSSVKKQWRRWWKENNDLSPVERLHQLIEELLLHSLLEHQKIIVFIDEIDYVKGLPFSTDEFFALIRSCFNDRSINPQYNQITFCLLGVATPGDLIENKKLTPFNIGAGIELKGFRLEEVESLIKGLEGKVIYPESVMSDILYWTGGQPFLTQRLCSLVVKEKNPTPNVSQIVQRMIIDNWEAQDEQEHLRTIKNRILNNEHRAGYLLELYRKVLKNEQVPINNISEERELQLSGLVVKKGNVIQVYNPIYALVFNESWIDTELNKLRPYSESYRAWLQSGKTDESRLLRGQALVEAEKWASGKNIGGEDRDFLGASRAKERVIEIERKDKQAAEERNILLEEANKNLQEANKKAKKRISIGSIVLGVSLLGAIILAVLAFREGVKATQAKKEADEAKNELVSTKEQSKQLQETIIREEENFKILNIEMKSIYKEKENAEKELKTSKNKLMEAQKIKDKAQYDLKQTQSQLLAIDKKYKNINTEIQTVTELVQLAGNLQDKGLSYDSNEALKKAGLSFKVENHNVKQALLLAAQAMANHSLKNREKANEMIKQSRQHLNQVSSSNQVVQQIQILVYVAEAKLNDQINIYQKAFNLLDESSYNPYQSSHKILSENMIENIHLVLLERLNNNTVTVINIKKSLKEHYKKRSQNYIKQLETFLKEKNWKSADDITGKALFYSAQSKKIDYGWNWRNTSCNDFKQIENLWYNYSGGKFGFKVQWEIYSRLNNNSPKYNETAYLNFAQKVGWYDPTIYEYGWSHPIIGWQDTEAQSIPKGNLPIGVGGMRSMGDWTKGEREHFFSLTIACEL